jgi:type IV pilus assembly protein PilQ
MRTTQEKHIMMKWRAVAMAVFLATGAPVAVMAQGAIQSITSTQQAGADVVRVEFSEPLKSIPQGFVVQSPARVAIDLPGSTSNLPKPLIEMNQGNVRSVNLAQAGERMRLVVNLRQSTTYRAQLDGNALLIILDSGNNAGGSALAASSSAVGAVLTNTATSGPPTNFAPAQNSAVSGLKDIDFRRGADGSGRVVVTLPNNQTGVDIRQQGKNLMVEFTRTTLPDSLRRRLDVTDFGTPVNSITSSQQGDRVRMLIEPNGNWDHSAYQTDNQFVVEVRRTNIDPNKLTKGVGFQGEKLSLNFQSIEVRSLLQVIADFTNFNIVTSDTVSGSLTLRLKDVPWDQALDIIMQSKGLGMRRSGNVIWVAPRDELVAKETADLEAGKKKTELEPLRTQGFQLNYTKAEEVSKALSGGGAGGGGGGGGAGQSSRLLTQRGSVLFDTRTNQIFVTDVPSKLEEIQALIAKIDTSVRQVMIEARIVEANDTFGKSLGVKLGGSDLRGVRGGLPGWGGNDRIGVGGNYDAIGYQTGQASGTSGYSNSQFVDLGAGRLNGFGPGSLALSLFGAASNRFLNLEISALEADGRGKIVASPRVVTADQVKAMISQGQKIPFQRATSSGATAIDFVEAMLRLDVTPQITPEGNIILDVKVNKDSLAANAGGLGYVVNVKEVKTQVLVENGGTVVIGGIYEQNETSSVTKVPVLGDIPILGNLFKTTSRDSSRTELLVFLTPRVVSERSAAR